jgi:hypothetical protein
MNVSPKLSVVVVVFRMSRQAMNTLYSLSDCYQQHVAAADYEVIVVENESVDMLDPAQVSALGDNFYYHRREEVGVSPVPALNHALQHCRGELLGLIVDGARMLSPRALHYALMASAMVADAVVTIPGYHLGDVDQKQHLSAGHSEQVEIARLGELEWKNNGYRLFRYACWSSGNKSGYLQPMMESSALFCHRSSYEELGGAPAAFDQAGGGSVNLYLYRKLLMRADAQLFVLAGEGSFHQYHGGVTTSEAPEREAILREFDQRLEEIYGEPFKSTAREPQVLGAVSAWAQPFLKQSLERSMRRFSIHAKEGRTFWDDECFDYWTENESSRDEDLRRAKVKDWQQNA